MAITVSVTQPSVVPAILAGALVTIAFLGSTLPTGAAGGDLSGTFPNPTVAKVAGVTPGALGLALLDDANAAAGRGTLGLGTIATQAASAVAITGGAIDGTTVGASTPATGAFTSLAANAAVTMTAGTASTSSTTGTLVVTGGVGISGALNAGNDTDGTHVLGRAKIGSFVASDSAAFTHFDMATATSYALLQTNGGDTYLNASASHKIDLSINDVFKLRVASTGDVSMASTTDATSPTAAALMAAGGIAAAKAIYGGTLAVIGPASGSTTDWQLTLRENANKLGLAIVANTNNRYNWAIASQFNVNKGFEITPSTATGGSTYSTPAIVILGDTRDVLIGTNTDDGTNKLQVAGTVAFTNASSGRVITATQTNSVGYSAAGSSSWNGARYNNAATTSGAAIGFEFNVAGNQISSVVGVREATSSDTGHLAFLTSNAGTYGERGRFTNAGNLLLGTTTDNATDKLQVNGSVQVKGGTNPYVDLNDGTGSGYLQVAAGDINFVPRSGKGVTISGSYFKSNVRVELAQTSANNYIGQGTGWMWSSDGTSGGTLRAGIYGQSAGSLNLFGGTNASNVNLTIDSGGLSTFTVYDAGTTNEPNVVTLNHRTSGAPGVGFGTRLSFIAQTTTTNDVAQSLIISQWDDATHASRKGQVQFYAYDTSARLALAIAASGSAAAIGFLGASASVRTAITGSRGGNAALANLLTELAAKGLITDSTTA